MEFEQPGGADLLPSQYADLRSRAQTPEQRLALAVLEDAIACSQGRVTLDSAGAYKNRVVIRQLEAVAWLAGADCPFKLSFENVCAILGIDAGYLRAGIAAGCHGPINRRSAPHTRATRVTANSSPYASKSVEA